MNRPMRALAPAVRSALPPARMTPVHLRARSRSPRLPTTGRIRGAADNDYTAGVSAPRWRLAERVHHTDRCSSPLRRKGGKGSGEFVPVSLDDASTHRLKTPILRAKVATARASVWPYHYAGTMGLVMRDGSHRFAPRQKYAASTPHLA